VEISETTTVQCCIAMYHVTMSRDKVDVARSPAGLCYNDVGSVLDG